MNEFEQLKEYKRLLDEGIITQEEFEIKKKSILYKEFAEETTANTPKTGAQFFRGETSEPYGTAKRYDKHLFVWVFSFLLGAYGVDRFLRGHIGLGVLKILTAGGFGIWWLIDLIIAIIHAYDSSRNTTENIYFDINGNYIL